MPISQAEVVDAYRVILRRSPENDLVVSDHMSRPDLASLFSALLTSDEFSLGQSGGFRVVEIGPRKIFLAGDPNDEYFRDAHYHAPSFSTVQKLAAMQNSQNILDVGANIGLSTIALSVACPDAQIIALEPSPKNFLFLSINLHMNGLTNVHALQFALSDKNGEISFHQSRVGSASHVVSRDHMAKEMSNVTVKTLRMDDLVNTYARGRSIDFIKIDAEGHEPNIIAGAERVLVAGQTLIFMEFNSWCLNAQGGHSPAAFAKKLWEVFDILELTMGDHLQQITLESRDFLHDNLVKHGCVDDIIMRYKCDGCRFPTLSELSWPIDAIEAVKSKSSQSSA